MSTPETIFGQLIDASQVEEAVKSTLIAWMEEYMEEYEYQQDIPIGDLPRPRSWVVAEDVNRESGDQLPSIVIVSPGLNGDAPLHDGEGNYSAWWRVGIGAFVSAKDRNSTKALIRQYIAILRQIVLQQQGGYSSGVRWIDESYDDSFAFTDQLTISAGQIVVDVQVDEAVNVWAGPRGVPTVPLPQPPQTWPPVESVDAAVEPLEVDVDAGE